MVTVILTIIGLVAGYLIGFLVGANKPEPPQPVYLAPGVLWIPEGLGNFALGINGKIERIATGGEPCLIYEEVGVDV